MIKAAVAISSISSFLVYQLFLVNYGVDLSELYFIASSLTISAWCLLSVKKNDSIIDSSSTIMCATFFSVLVIIYAYRWILFGDGSTNYYTAACFSALFTLIYLVYYVIRNKPDSNNE